MREYLSSTLAGSARKGLQQTCPLVHFSKCSAKPISPQISHCARTVVVHSFATSATEGIRSEFCIEQLFDNRWKRSLSEAIATRPYEGILGLFGLSRTNFKDPSFLKSLATHHNISVEALLEHAPLYARGVSILIPSG